MGQKIGLEELQKVKKSDNYFKKRQKGTENGKKINQRWAESRAFRGTKRGPKRLPKETKMEPNPSRNRKEAEIGKRTGNRIKREQKAKQ